jgi:sulfate adenylyltransferase subunit 1 (EFTu-like GTPase family)
MDWYRGPTLIEHLEQVQIADAPQGRPFRMPVQLVNRPTPDFRGYSGLIASGEVYVGMPIRIMPSEQTSRVDRIVTYDDDLQRASAGQSVTITLADEVDASRGDVLAHAEALPAVTDRLTSRIVWMGTEPLAPGRRYLIKLGTCTATATVEPALRVFDLDTRASVAADRLSINDIGNCVLRLDRPIAVDAYAASRETGSFILIDRESYDTVGMGFVEKAETGSAESSGLRKWLRVLTGRRITKAASPPPVESHFLSIVKAINGRPTLND